MAAEEKLLSMKPAADLALLVAMRMVGQLPAGVACGPVVSMIGSDVPDSNAAIIVLVAVVPQGDDVKMRDAYHDINDQILGVPSHINGARVRRM